MALFTSSVEWVFDSRKAVNTAIQRTDGGACFVMGNFVYMKRNALPENSSIS
jgi:hypothetical protein